ncbi:MAG TPA: DUF6531 domain-containing protein, partial [Thermomicrobiales bacterium]
MGRRGATAGRRWGIVLLVVVLLLPGTPEALLRLHAERLAQRRAAAMAAPGRNALPARGERHQAAAPTASGAFANYPLNSTFDAEPMLVGTPPTNFDFETAGYAVGTPPTNSDLETAPVTDGTPTNDDFATGDFTGWTVTGSPSIQSDTEHGYYAQMSGTADLKTAAFTVGNDVQSFVVDGYWPTNNGWIEVSVLPGPTYTTSIGIGDIRCVSNCAWREVTFDATGYQGQSVELLFHRRSGTAAFDRVRAQVIAPGYVLSGDFGRDVSGGNAELRVSGSATTSAFTLDDAVQHGRVTAWGTGSNPYINVYVLYGASFASSTKLATLELGATAQIYQFPLYDHHGEQVKLKFTSTTGTIRIDNVGIQRVDFPGWTLSNPSLTWGPTAPVGAMAGGGATGGSAVSLRGEYLVSGAFAPPANAQQLSVKLKADGASNTNVYIELLTGATFGTVVNLAGGASTVAASPSGWTTFHVAIGSYAGQTVKLRLRANSGRTLIDDAGFLEHVAPGWVPLAGYGAITVEEDANGTYLTSYAAGGSYEVTSSMVSAGVVDDTTRADARSVSFAYAFGGTGSRVTVWWVPVTGGTPGTPIQVYDKTTDGTTTFKDARFKLLDSYVQTGYYKIKGTGGARIYAIADNVARQQLGEPFSMPVGVGIDTSTGSFGWAETDVTVEGGAMPLSFTRYYAGHADRLGSMGYRWRHSYDT